jgi:hypothetical protein
MPFGLRDERPHGMVGLRARRGVTRSARAELPTFRLASRSGPESLGKTSPRRPGYLWRPSAPTKDGPLLLVVAILIAPCVSRLVVSVGLSDAETARATITLRRGGESKDGYVLCRGGG